MIFFSSLFVFLWVLYHGFLASLRQRRGRGRRSINENKGFTETRGSGCARLGEAWDVSWNEEAGREARQTARHGNAEICSDQKHRCITAGHSGAAAYLASFYPLSHIVLWLLASFDFLLFYKLIFYSLLTSK